MTLDKDHLRLVDELRGCMLCASQLPQPPKPVFQCLPAARILISGQAPGKKAHNSGIPFDDASGQRLRNWLGVDAKCFYDPEKIAIVPMAFCYPGSGNSGDLPPRPECAVHWRHQLLAHLPNIELTLVIGRYAQRWHLAERRKATLTETVKAWREYWPGAIPLPHPSPRNNRWLKQNPWFEAELLPPLRQAISRLL
ncbi:uracil-DNA glycosylase family protein [Methylomarinum sp. Ch1-1]|uniref:Uracil-DNA glycosylase family protein n=1 Tax=Methylomarinum roseum TaxID=3067653 RepID=A0AAU7NTK9_9GAMM|nr:uracil-DNA glycosylase family protein [Methylomarinum sp. Ch1-1]MDP4519713.1 uracil-DNA glycosylase family protein [Methylomarinum sp. Ch1-1]